MRKRFAILCTIVVLLVPLSGFADGTPDAVLSVRDSVVRVVVETPFGPNSGTGFAIGDKQPVQYIVTNNHVIDGATKISIWLTRDNLIEATVQNSLPGSDLAILKVTSPLYDVKPVTINDAVAKEGSKGYALGFPGASDVLSSTITGNKEDITITDGIVSTLSSVQWVSGLQPVNVYQINAAINPGNSGGPFVNVKGEVIGISSWSITDANGINAAIQVRDLTAVLDQNGIPYIKAKSVTTLWGVLIGAGVILLAALIVLIVLLLKKNKKVKGVLYCIKGEFAGQRFYFDKDMPAMNIGRDASLCQLVLPMDSPMVSRSHCNLRFNPGDSTFTLVDLNSANGTYLANGTRLEPKIPVTMQSGTKFYLGDNENLFSVGIEG